jgi:nickel-dependent lactate racemase
LGNIKDNPFRNEICEAAKLAKLDFVINAVYNSIEGVKGIVAGHFEKSQEFGADTCLNEFAINFDEAADVTIASAFPYSEGPQLMKPIGPATMVTKKGGTVIIYASAIKGGRFPDPLLEAFDTAYAISGGDARRLVLDFLSKGDLIVPNAPMDFNAALNITLLYLSRVNVILVSKDADQEQAARLGFSFANSLDNAIEKVSKDIPDATLNILPSGGLLIPVLNEKMIFEW